MKTSLHIRALSFAFCTMLFLFGCDSASTNDDVVDDDTTTDVATTVALSVSEEDGGVADQLEDVVAITSELSLNKDEASHATIFSRQPEYDESTGTWTVEIDRDRTSANGQRSMSYQRTYTYQFLDANGQPQQFFTTDSTRAKTVIFRILEGSGEYASPEVVNSLNALTADWTIDNADEDVFSISGSYFRDASSTIERTLVTRTMDHALNLSQLEINVPRGGGLRDFTGTLSGSYEAIRNTNVENAERNVEISASIEITVNDNQVIIDIDRERFVSTLDTGELIP